ncbi:hypothetical protein [Microbacterium hominis]|nr:hypothetical protein [Microbacterium hominis]
MTKPEITKNTSTPANPPRGQPGGVRADDGQHGERAQTLDVAT